MKKSTKISKINKPPKPYPDFPLTPHNSGRWCKSIRGKVVYFSAWGRRKDGELVQFSNGGEWREALDMYQEQREDLYLGREPRQTAEDDLTLAELCNKYLTTKSYLLENDEIVVRTFQECRISTDRVISFFGKKCAVENLTPEDFGRFRKQMAKNVSPVSLGKYIQSCRSIFNFAFDEALIPKPIVFGRSFKKPSKKVLRKSRNGNGQRMFEAEEMRTILDAADPVMRAMVLLGVNCGFGQSDISNLPKSALDLENGWVDYPRPKTAIDRRIPLWPKTVEALRFAIENRPESKEEADSALVFITKYGNKWVKNSDGEKQSWVDAIGLLFGRLLTQLDLKRLGLNFYALRHTFETIGGESKDQVAVNACMGHVDDSMAGVYRERISDERLKAVTDTVYEWLFTDRS